MIDTDALRKKILDLAICGKLSVQNTEIESAQNDLKELNLLKKDLLNNKILKKEKIAECENRDIPFEIPENWRWCQLADLCKTVTDGTHKTPTYIEQGIPFLSVKNISSGTFDFKDVKYISEQEHEELLKRCNPELGDVLFCRIGTLGKAIEIDFEPSFSIFVSLGLIKPLDPYLSKYLVNVFNSGYGERWITKNKAGDSMHAAKINLDVLRAFIVPLPPREEQKRIVKRLKALFALLDEIDNLQESYNSNIRTLRNKLIDAGIQGKLTEQFPEDGTAEKLYVDIQEEKAKLIKEQKIKKEKRLAEITEAEIPFNIPAHWKWVRLADVANRVWAGGDKPNDFAPIASEGRTIPVVANGVTDDGILGYTSEAKAPAETITVAGRGTIGFCTYRNYEYCPIVRLIVIEPSRGVNPKYLKLVMYALQERSVGSSIPQLTVPMIKPKLIPLPPYKEQLRIVDRIEEILSLI